MSLKAFILKCLSKRRYSDEFNPATFKKILIVRPAKIGDTICMYPMIRELKKALPNVRIDIYASVHNNFMFRYVDLVDKVYTKYKSRYFVKFIREILRMRKNRYDLVIDTIETRFDKVMALLLIKPVWAIAGSGPGRRYNLLNEDLSFYYKTSAWRAVHMTEQLLLYLQMLDINQYDNKMEYPFGEAAREFADKFMAQHGNVDFIGLNAEASSIDRSVSQAEILDICQRFQKYNKDLKILLFSAPAQRNEIIKMVEDNPQLNNIIPEQGSSNIFDSAALVNKLRVMLTPDTCFVHIASVYNIPTVAIYEDRDEVVTSWAPRSDTHVIMRRDPTKQNSFSINEAVNAVIDILEKNQQPAHAE